MAPRYPVLTQNSNKVFNDLRKLDGFGAELEKMIGAGRAADGITSADVAEYLAKLGTEAQNTRYRLSTTITKTDLDQLENKLAEFKAVEFNLPPSKGVSTFAPPDAKLGYFQVKNDDRETVEALVSLYNQGIIDSSWNFQPINAANDSGVVVNIDNILEAAGSPSQLQTLSPNHLMSSMAHKDYELSFFMTVKDLNYSSACLITEIAPTADAFAYKYVDLDVLLNQASTDAKNQNNAFIATIDGNGDDDLDLSDEIKVSVYRMAGEISIRLEDKNGYSPGLKTFTCGESAHFGFLANPNVSIRGITMNGIRAVIDDGGGVDGQGFAYNVLSSESGDVIVYQHKPSLAAGEGYVEAISLRAGRFVSEFKYNTRDQQNIYQAGNGNFVLVKIGYGQALKYALIGSGDASIAPLTMEIEAFNALIEPLFGDYTVQAIHETVNTVSGNTVLKVHLGKTELVVDPYATEQEKAAGLTTLNKLTGIRVVSLERISDTEWSASSEDVEIKLPPKYFLLSSTALNPGNIIREPTGQDAAEVNAKIGYRAHVGYKLVESETEALKKMPLVLILLDGVLVGELPMLAYTSDGQALTDISEETPLPVDLSRYEIYINCVSSDAERVMVLAGAFPSRTSEFAVPPQGERWAVASTIKLADATTLKGQALDPATESWQAISATIYNVKDDRFGAVEFATSDPTKIMNFDTYGYGQTICLSRNVLVAPCRDPYYKSIAVYKIDHGIPPDYSIGFMGSPPSLELRCIIETHEPSGRWLAGPFNRVTVNSTWLAATDWYNGNLHVISIDSLFNGRDRIIKALPEDFSNSVNNYRVTRPESAATLPIPPNTVLNEGSYEYVEEGTDMATITDIIPKIVVAADTSFTYDNKTFTLDTETKTYSHTEAGGDVLVITFAAETPTFTFKRNDVLEFTGEYWSNSEWEPNKYSFTAGGAGGAGGVSWSGKEAVVEGTVITAAAARALMEAFSVTMTAGIAAGYYQLI